MTLLYPVALGSPLPSRPGLGLTMIIVAEGYGDVSDFEEAVADLWQRLVQISPLEALDEPAGNCCVYTFHDPTDRTPTGVTTQPDGALGADPEALLAVLTDLQLAELTGADPVAPLTGLPWPSDGANRYATSLLVVLVDPGLHTGRGEYLGLDHPDLPYHLVVSAGPDDATAVAIALGRMAGLSDETGELAGVPPFARRRNGLNVITESLQELIDAGTAADPWLPFRGAAAFAPQRILLDGDAYLRPGGPTLLAAPRVGAIPAELLARGFGLTGVLAFGGWA